MEQAIEMFAAVNSGLPIILTIVCWMHVVKATAS